MQRIRSCHLSAHAGTEVTLAGWVHRRRLLKSVAFLILRDATGLAQIVTGPDELAGLREETVVRVTGTVRTNPAAPGGAELVDPRVEVLGEPAGPLPFEVYRPEVAAALPVRLDHAALALRHPGRRAVCEISAAVAGGFRAALDAQGFVEVHTPKLVASATESGAEVFGVDYFGTRAYLAQSPQFYKQVMVGVLERVYEVGPVFRAEPHDTARHLAEYTSLDAELAFVEDDAQVRAVARDAVAGMVEAVRTRAGGALSLVDAVLPEVPARVPEVHFAQARRLLGEAFGEDLSREPDLAPAHERWLGEWARSEHGSDLLFVTGYPMAKRPFYTHPQPGHPEHANGFDLLFRGMEVATGGQRLHRYEDYVAALAARGEPLAPYEPYLRTFRYGMPPHGGFAIGLERFVARLVGAANVREVTPFPRDVHRLAP